METINEYAAKIARPEGGFCLCDSEEICRLHETARKILRQLEEQIREEDANMLIAYCKEIRRRVGEHHYPNEIAELIRNRKIE